MNTIEKGQNSPKRDKTPLNLVESISLVSFAIKLKNAITCERRYL